MARKPMIALWKFLACGVVAAGGGVKPLLKRGFGATPATAVRDEKGCAWSGATVTLIIGPDSGAASVTAQIQGHASPL